MSLKTIPITRFVAQRFDVPIQNVPGSAEREERSQVKLRCNGLTQRRRGPNFRVGITFNDAVKAPRLAPDRGLK